MPSAVIPSRIIVGLMNTIKLRFLDLSLEYYYSEGSYAAVGLFWKDVDNWIDNTQVKTTFEGLHDVYLGERWNNAVAAIEGRGDQATDTAIYNEIVANGVGIGENNRINQVRHDDNYYP